MSCLWVWPTHISTQATHTKILYVHVDQFLCQAFCLCVATSGQRSKWHHQRGLQTALGQASCPAFAGGDWGVPAPTHTHLPPGQQADGQGRHLLQTPHGPPPATQPPQFGHACCQVLFLSLKGVRADHRPGLHSRVSVRFCGCLMWSVTVGLFVNVGFSFF